jgi:TatD DNase family protein
LELVDSHCHLNFDSFDADRISVLHRARQEGINKILIPGVDIPSSKFATSLATDHSDLYAAIGIHPNNGSVWDDHSVLELSNLAKSPTVVAIGEIGLDFYRDRIPQDHQKHILQAQLQLAFELNLPVVVHNRKATNDIMVILDEWYTTLKKAKSYLVDHPGVLHSYEGDLSTAYQLIQMNFLIGINGVVTFRNAADHQNLVTGLPLEKMLLETDAPFLAPHPHRGQRNEPSYICAIVEKIASLKGLSPELVAEMTTSNAKNLFRWD